MRRKNFEPTIHSKLCAKHFLESDIIKRFGQTKLRNGTIPSIFDFPENSRMKPPELSKSRTRLEKEIQKESTSKEKKLDLRSTRLLFPFQLCDIFVYTLINFQY